VTSAPLPEGTSDPPQPRRRMIVVSLLGLRSWLGSYFGGFLVEACFQIVNGGVHAFPRGAAANFFRRQRRLNTQASGKVRFQSGRDFLQSLEWQRGPH